MQLRQFIASSVGVTAIVALVVVSAYSSLSQRVPPREVIAMPLTGTTLSLNVPVDWDSSDRSSCNQPCIRLRQPAGEEGGRPVWPTITLEVVEPQGAVTTLDEYQLQLERTEDLRTTRIGGMRALEYETSGNVIIDSIESFALGRSRVLKIDHRHYIFKPGRVLYKCSLEGSAEDVAAYSDVFESFCASVGVSG